MEEVDRRLSVQLLHQWQQACDVSLPRLGLFRPAATMGLWPNCILAAVENEPKRAYKCEHIGTALVPVFGEDLANGYLPTSTDYPLSVLTSKLADVVATKRPAEDAGEYKNRAGKLIKFRACFLPYSEDSKTVTHILIGFNCKEF